MTERTSHTPSISESLRTFLVQPGNFCFLEHERRVDSVHGCRYIGSYLDWVLRDRVWCPTCLVPASPLSLRPVVEYHVARWYYDKSSVLMQPGGYRGHDSAPKVTATPYYEQAVILSTTPTERLDLAMHACRARGSRVIGIISLVHESAGAQMITLGDTIVPFHGLLHPRNLEQEPTTDTAEVIAS